LEITRVSDLGDDAFKEISPIAREINDSNTLDNFNDLLAMKMAMNNRYWVSLY